MISDQPAKLPHSIKTDRNVLCDYCGKEADFVTGFVIYPRRHDLSHKRFWYCKDCSAYVGCHGESDYPLGRLAKADLRAGKILAHAAFDRLWRERKLFTRKQAYAWLAEKLGIDVDDCHIGNFDLETCNKVVTICEEKNRETPDV